MEQNNDDIDSMFSKIESRGKNISELERTRKLLDLNYQIWKKERTQSSLAHLCFNMGELSVVLKYMSDNDDTDKDQELQTLLTMTQKLLELWWKEILEHGINN